MTRLAVFDLDSTLTRRGTWGRFVATFLKGRPVCAVKTLLAAGAMQWRYKRGLVPRMAVKTAMMQSSITGLPREAMEKTADAFVAADLDTGMNRRVIEALCKHRERGDRVLIASAGVDMLVERYAAALEACGNVCTEFDWTDDDRLSDCFGSENCYGEEKLAQVKAWRAKHAPDSDFVVAYSDSRCDAPLLEWADKAIVIAPNRKTRRYAEQNRFEIWDDVE
ncbi:MAG: HAD-IB family hydrolase [Litorimonas sp.]